MNIGRIKIIQVTMILINVLAVLFTPLCIYVISVKICDTYTAREFLNKVNYISKNPTASLFLSILLIIILIISFILREHIGKTNKSFIYVSLAFDFILCIGLMSIQHFNYNGILFWVFANIIYYAHDKVKIIAMLLAMSIYIGTNYEVLSIRSELFSLNEYIGYYNLTNQQYLIGVYNALGSLNIIVFILLCIEVIQGQQGIIERINALYTTLAKTNDELKNANEELKEYAIMKEKMGETKERNRLAREIHDTLGHTLTGISAGLDACLTTIEISPEKTKKQLEIISKATREGIGEVRRSVNKLRPDALERLCLESAIKTMIWDMKEVSQVDIGLKYNIGGYSINQDEETTIYRMVQESITNAIRHGKATKVYINIEKKDDDLYVEISDNGIGCQMIKEGFGVKHMRERIRMLHGCMYFENNDGFLVKAIIPTRWEKNYD